MLSFVFRSVRIFTCAALGSWPAGPNQFDTNDIIFCRGRAPTEGRSNEDEAARRGPRLGRGARENGTSRSQRQSTPPPRQRSRCCVPRVRCVRHAYERDETLKTSSGGREVRASQQSRDIASQRLSVLMPLDDAARYICPSVSVTHALSAFTRLSLFSDWEIVLVPAEGGPPVAAWRRAEHRREE